MKLKEIKPGMVIHCKNDEEKKALLEEAERIGYRWSSSEKLPTDKTVDSGMTIRFYNKNEWKDFKHITWSNTNEGAIEFSDLILPELTAEEAIKIHSEMCRKGVCELCPISIKNNGEEKDCDTFCIEHAEKAVEILAKWKADHTKKEPEIETVDICRIIEIQPDGRKRCVHEEDISDGELMYSGDAVEKCRYILKNYCKEHDGEFIAVHEVVSRVKAV